MCSRDIAGETHTFGTTGYTMDRIFVLYDRNSDSIWYPLGEGTFDAVAGDKKGTQVPFVSEPDPILLKEWVVDHPETLVLMPTKEDLARRNRGFLGVQLESDGVTVTSTMEDSGAAKAGILAGDRIVRIGEHDIEDRGDLQRALSGTMAGDELKVRVERDGEMRDLPVTLGRRS